MTHLTRMDEHSDVISQSENDTFYNEKQDKEHILFDLAVSTPPNRSTHTELHMHLSNTKLHRVSDANHVINNRKQNT